MTLGFKSENCQQPAVWSWEGPFFIFLRLSINTYKMKCSWISNIKFHSGFKDSVSFELGPEWYLTRGREKKDYLTCMGETSNCDPEQIIEPFCASVSSASKWG